MSGSEHAGDDQTKNVEGLTKELAAMTTKYNNLEAAHTTTKEDLRVAKASTADIIKLQKELDKSIAEKSALMVKIGEADDALKAFKSDVTKDKVKSVLSTALDEAGARNSSTAMKLLDMSSEGLVDENGIVVPAKIAELIGALKTSDPVLFREDGESGVLPKVVPKSPTVKHAEDRITKSAYETEMAAAKTPEAVSAVLEKYSTAVV